MCEPAGRGGRELALGEAVDLVVHHDVGEVDVAADRVGQVAAADREAVAVAAGHQHQQVGVGDLDALGDGQRAAVDAVEAVGRGVAGDAARAADARDEGDLVGRPADGRQRAVERLQHAEVPAAGAPDRLEVALEVLGLHGPGRRQRGGHHITPVAARASWLSLCSASAAWRRWAATSQGGNGLAPLFANERTPFGRSRNMRSIR